MKRLSEIREEVRYILSDLVPIPAFPTDSNRECFLFTEVDTLLTIISMAEQQRYKECLIILRTVFEKYLFFWLMFEGKKYRHPMFYNVTKKTSKTDKEARDATLALWKNLWKTGDKRFKDVISIDAGKKDNVLKVIYEFEGYKLISDGIPTGEIIPAYNAILEEYNPDIAHVGELKFIVSNSPFTKSSEETILTQKTIYHNFFYIENLLRNLRINQLIDKKKLEMIKIHYNFLSKYIHVSMNNLQIWQDCSLTYQQKQYDSEVYYRLITLYSAKLFHLYLKTYVNGYKNNASPVKFERYQAIIQELEELSKDLWFFDNDPTEYDVKNSDYLKDVQKRLMKESSNDFIYYDDPLYRMKQLIGYQKQTAH